MKIKLVNPETGEVLNSKYNGTYRVQRTEHHVVKTVFFSDKSGDFCRGATHTKHIIDHGPVHAIERIKEDNFDGRGKIKCYINLIGQKYGSYLYAKPCIIAGVTS